MIEGKYLCAASSAATVALVCPCLVPTLLCCAVLYCAVLDYLLPPSSIFSALLDPLSRSKLTQLGTVDTDQSGSISVVEMREGLRKLGFESSYDDVKALCGEYRDPKDIEVTQNSPPPLQRPLFHPISTRLNRSLRSLFARGQIRLIEITTARWAYASSTVRLEQQTKAEATGARQNDSEALACPGEKKFSRGLLSRGRAREHERHCSPCSVQRTASARALRLLRRIRFG